MSISIDILNTKELYGRKYIEYNKSEIIKFDSIVAILKKLH